jgi:glycosyltransferase involved in cell wall biosynthesis
MKILMALTYYRPHVSGLTIYVQRLAEALAARGHQVTVLTSHYTPELPKEEVMNGVRVVRVPALMKVSKGVIMPTFAWWALRLIRENEVVSIHLPQFEASILTFLCRCVLRRPCYITYHCDLQLPPGAFNGLVGAVVHIGNYVAGLLADGVVAYTEDYATHSPYLSGFKHKLKVIYPPVVIPPVDPAARRAFRDRLGLDDQRVVGFAARIAAEKGVEYLLGALPYILPEMPNARILFAGEYRNVIGENAYFDKLQPLIEQNRPYLTFLGVLSPQEMSAFFASCDVLVLSSVNSTESFGLVQVESMLCGTPVVAADLPGVREPIRLTGMGETVPIRDERAIAAAVLKVIGNRSAYVKPRDDIAALFDLQRTVVEYERLFGNR